VAGASFDQRLAGTWREVRSSQSLAVFAQKPPVLTTGSSRTISFGPVGEETVRYDDDAAYRGTLDGRPVAMSIKGTQVTTRGNRMYFEGRESEGSYVLRWGLTRRARGAVKAKSGRVDYTCEGDRHTQRIDGYEAECVRAR
jgi:hypothetical protein